MVSIYRPTTLVRTLRPYLTLTAQPRYSLFASQQRSMAHLFRSRGRKIVAIGRNFADHAKELGNAVPTEPFFFLKPTSSYIDNEGTIEIPQGILAHFEIELAAVIGKTGRDIAEEDAMSYVAGYALAIDMTARNLQDKVKKAGLPWSAAKGFDTFTPVSSFVPLSSVEDPHNLRLWLKTNGQPRQDGNTKNVIFRLPRLIQHVSSIMTLEEGDLILTGTPSGVGETVPGDYITSGLETVEGTVLANLNVKVVQRKGGYAFNG